jgi:hypothetical protein
MKRLVPREDVATHWTGRTVGESEGFEPRLIGYGLRRHDAMLQ